MLTSDSTDVLREGLVQPVEEGVLLPTTLSLRRRGPTVGPEVRGVSPFLVVVVTVLVLAVSSRLNANESKDMSIKVVKLPSGLKDVDVVDRESNGEGSERATGWRVVAMAGTAGSVTGDGGRWLSPFKISSTSFGTVGGGGGTS